MSPIVQAIDFYCSFPCNKKAQMFRLANIGATHLMIIYFLESSKELSKKYFYLIVY